MSAAAGRGPRMQLVSGRSYWPADPRAEDVDINDIAHALGMLCRFGGQCDYFYSVAEHSVNVSYCVEPQHALQALLHDATEAYLGDVIRPVKDLLGEAYRRLERLNWRVIAPRFGVSTRMHPNVKLADEAMLSLEYDTLKPRDLCVLDDLPETPTIDIPECVEIQCLPPRAAKKAFLDRFNQLTKG